MDWSLFFRTFVLLLLRLSFNGFHFVRGGFVWFPSPKGFKGHSSFIKGYILTDISRDGMLSGLDVDLFKLYLSLTKKSVVIGGGLSNNQDLFNLKKTNMSNLEGVIAGKSFYVGNIDLKKAQQILDNNA